MGMWNMSVLGVGAHHNFKRADDGSLVPDGAGDFERVCADADKLFKEFVAKLRAAGHSIEHASFTYGGRDSG